MFPTDENGNIIATQVCTTQNQYDASSSLLVTSTQDCYKPLDIYYSYAVEIGFIALLFIGLIALIKITRN